MNRRTIPILLTTLVIVFTTGCKENYSNGEKVGTLIEFAKKGVIWDSWEGRLNMTQTGMNTGGDPFSFSFDNDRSDQDSLVSLLYQAQIDGWKVKIKYHAVWGFKNFFSNRDFSNVMKRMVDGDRSGRVVDTVWVVIDKSQIKP